MTNKDFLSQFSGNNNKPASFSEEERVKITKEKKPVNVKLIAIIVAAILLIGGLVAFLLLRPTIEVKDFVGLDQSEVKAWVKQNEISTQGIIIKEEYNFDYDEGYIVSQSIEAGKKVRKNVKMDFVVSIGADPDELISVPDIKNMYKDDIQDWIKSNKLQKAKLTSSYSDDKEAGEVISYEFKNCDEDTFTRSSTLNIVVSKGPQPAGVAVVSDFVEKSFSMVESWGKTNKITIEKLTAYSDKVDLDCVISQSVEAKKEMKEGETLTVVVSLGKGIKVPDFKAMSKSDVDEWISENNGFVKTRKKYSEQSAYVLEQSIAAGKYVGEDDTLKLTINLGNHFYLDDVLETSLESKSYDRIKDKTKELEELGLSIDIHRNYVDSDEPRNTILSIEKINDASAEYSEVEGLPLKVEITFNVSNGNLKNQILIEKSYIVSNKEYSWADALSLLLPYTKEEAEKLCDASGANYVLDIISIPYINESEIEITAKSKVASIKINNKSILNYIGKYIDKENDVIKVVIYEYVKIELQKEDPSKEPTDPDKKTNS